MKTALALCFLLAVTLSASVTGSWGGSYISGDPNGDTKNVDANVVTANLTQSGTAVTGTCGPDASHQYAISNGQVNGDQVKFQASNGDLVYSFTLTQAANGDLNGTVAYGSRVGNVSLKKR